VQIQGRLRINKPAEPSVNPASKHNPKLFELSPLEETSSVVRNFVLGASSTSGADLGFKPTLYRKT
jgi:hypothetical protein